LQALAIGAAHVGAQGAAQVGAGAQHVGAGAQHDGAGAQQLDLQHLGLQHLNRSKLHLCLQQLLQPLLQPLLHRLHDGAGAQHVGAAGAQHVGAATGAQQVGAGAQQLESACASVALAQQNSTAAVSVVHFIMGISWKGVCRSGTEANPGHPVIPRGKSRPDPDARRETIG
jgi:hypothetical protein